MMEGDTLHHFVGVGIGKASQLSKKKAMNNLRWLVIDEISQEYRGEQRGEGEISKVRGTTASQVSKY